MMNVLRRKYLAIALLASVLGMAGEVRADYADSSNCDYGNPCEPYCCEPAGGSWVIGADLLYWRGLQNGLECGCGSKIKDRWDLGYRIGLAYESECSSWDVGAFWTHFHNPSNRKGGDDNSGSGSGAGSGSYGKNSARWKLNYDTIDVLVGYEFNSDCCFTYTPFIGLRGAWIDEKLNSHYGNCHCSHSSRSSSSFSSSSSSSSSSSGWCSDCGNFSSGEGRVFTHEHHKERFWGVGPEIGVRGLWNLGCGFSVYGGIGFGFLYGQFDIKVHDSQEISNPTDNGECCIKRNFQACQAIADAAIGVQWEKCLCNDIELLLRLGLEHHRYFNQNHIGGYGDLCLDGANFTAAIKY